MGGSRELADTCVLRLERVTKRYRQGPRELTVLREVDLSLWPGELLVVLGPSGSGKTTLLNLMGGLDRVSTGHIRFGELDLATATAAQLTHYRRHHVGFVFQFFNLVPNLTAYENVELAAYLVEQPLPVDDLLEQFGLADRKTHFPAQLSGGEQQRVAIARAVVKRPALLLCDEPTGALDYETAKDVLGLIQELPERFGTTVVLVTHNQAIATIGHRVIRLRSGEVVAVSRNETPLAASELIW